MKITSEKKDNYKIRAITSKMKTETDHSTRKII